MDPSLATLLGECGVHISDAEWEQAFPPTPATVPKPGMTPISVFGGKPMFSSSQVAWCAPEVFGYDDYGVIEDAETAHPWVLDWNDEQYYWGNHRPIHRYSRLYRLRWTLSHVLGLAGQVADATVDALRQQLPCGMMQTRKAYEWVRSTAHRQGLTLHALSIPLLVRKLGGPTWKVSHEQYHTVLREMERLHRGFAQFRLGRQRFPKMQYVLLRLLDEAGVVPPYKVPWARTSIKRRQLGTFIATLRTSIDHEARRQRTGFTCDLETEYI